MQTHQLYLETGLADAGSVTAPYVLVGRELGVLSDSRDGRISKGILVHELNQIEDWAAGSVMGVLRGSGHEHTGHERQDMPIDLPPQSLCLPRREGHALSSGDVCSSIEGVYGDTRLGFLLLIAGGGSFLFDTAWGHGGGQRTVGKRPKGLAA